MSASAAETRKAADRSANQADDAADGGGRLSLTVANDVREWAIAQGDDSRIRIALCGYEGEHAMPETWECVAWKAQGGYGSQGENRARENSAKERIWFSPHCLQGNQSVFDFT